MAPALAGCGLTSEISPGSCDRSEDGNPLVTYSGGTVTGDSVLIYQTSEFDGELLYFPGGMRYSLEHQLGSVPQTWEAYLSFDRFGAEGGTVAPASGNQVELLSMDDEVLNVANGSCVDYWLLVTASNASDEESDSL